jgi:glutamate-1-semialdehyde 2,1-aminomutase
MPTGTVQGYVYYETAGCAEAHDPPPHPPPSRSFLSVPLAKNYDTLGPKDRALLERSQSVLPNLTHLSTSYYPTGYSQFFKSAEGCRVTDVDGKEYIDFMGSFGPMLLGHKHAGVEAAVRAQMLEGDCLPGPSERMVELAEKLVELHPFSAWAMFQKNGSDATTLATRIARAHTKKRVVLRAPGSYHGATPIWMAGPGVLAEEQAHQGHFTFNDLASVEAAVAEAGDDLAAIIVAGFR